MSTARDRALIVKVARMYYEQNMSQDQIARALLTSRSNVSRILSVAKKRGIVEIKINEATKLIQEGVVDTLEEVDLALVNSSGMPFGPISLGRQISKLDLIDNLDMLAERYDKPMFKPTKRVLGGGHKF